MSLFFSSSPLLYSLFYSASRSLREAPAAAAAPQQARRFACLLASLLAYKLAMAGMRLPTEHRATLLARFLQSPRALPCVPLSPVRSQAARRAALSPARFHPWIAPLTRPRFEFSTQVPRSSQPGPLRSNGFLTSPAPPPPSTDTVDAGEHEGSPISVSTTLYNQGWGACHF